MIAKLKGIIDTKFDDSVIIDVSGVGYHVFLSSKMLDDLSVGDNVSVRIAHIFRQETQYLCGFTNDEEINIFNALLDVPGIGVKSAMAVLSHLSIEEFATAVATQNTVTLCKVSGIGKKTAERILLELKDKNLGKVRDICEKHNSNVNDAILGLVSLGYQKHNIMNAIEEVSKNNTQDLSTNEIIVACLKLLS